MFQCEKLDRNIGLQALPSRCGSESNGTFTLQMQSRGHYGAELFRRNDNNYEVISSVVKRTIPASRPTSIKINERQIRGKWIVSLVCDTCYFHSEQLGFEFTFDADSELANFRPRMHSYV